MGCFREKGRSEGLDFGREGLVILFTLMGARSRARGAWERVIIGILLRM